MISTQTKIDLLSATTEDKIWAAIACAITEGWELSGFIRQTQTAWMCQLADRAKDAANADMDRLLGDMTTAAEMLWSVVANVNQGDWSKQNQQWQEAAARWRDNYFAIVKRYRLRKLAEGMGDADIEALVDFAESLRH